MQKFEHLRVIYILSLLLWNISFAQDQNLVVLENNHFQLKTNTKNGSPEWVKFSNESNYSRADIPNLCKEIFSNRQEDTWSLIRSENDNIGYIHERYQQFYNNIEVEGAVYIFHLKNDNLVSSNGDFIPNINLAVSPWLNEQQATTFALEVCTKDLSSITFEVTNVTTLITMTNEKPVLAFKCHVTSAQNLIDKSIYIDAQTGKFLKEINHVCNVDVTGVAYTQFSGVQSITTNSVSLSNYELQQSSTGGGIVTLKPGLGLPHMDSDNIWNNVNMEEDEFATDVHFGAETSYDFYFDNFGRNSFDNLGTVVTSAACNNIERLAIWYGSSNTMLYGKGDENYYPSVSLEVVAHEYTHGVTQYSAGLIYEGESGALSESFSDIFGSTIRKMYVPTVGSWYIGDQLLRPTGNGDLAFRNMASPNEFYNPDTYGGLYFNTGDILHIDCGIQNFWYYLLVEGGSGVNDLGNNYSVTGIGLEDAMKIAYRNLTVYLTPSSTFEDARDGSEQAAIDLFGYCSDQHLNVKRAWYAVGLEAFDAPPTSSANFAASAAAADVGQLIQFTDLSQPNPYAWQWNFGDGVTSALQNPTHAYSQAGNYTVTLITNFINVFCGVVVDSQSVNVLIGNDLGINPLTQSDNQLIIYPNPTSSNFTISTSIDVENLSYVIYDLSGRVIDFNAFQNMGNNLFEINPREILSGNYLVELKYESNHVVKTERHRVTFVR